MKKALFIAPIVLALIIAVTAADAGFFNRGPRCGGLIRIISRLDLTDAQKTNVANILKEKRNQLYTAQKRLYAETHQFKETILNEPYDETKIRDRFKKAALAGEELAVVVAGIVPLIKAELNEEQRAEIQKFKEKMNQTMPEIITKRKARLDKWIERHAQ